MIVSDFREFQGKSSELYHFGIKRRSGRYPWGSGERPYQSDPAKLEAEKAEKRQKRKEAIKKAAASVGKLALKSALIGGKSGIQ